MKLCLVNKMPAVLAFMAVGYSVALLHADDNPFDERLGLEWKISEAQDQEGQLHKQAQQLRAQADLKAKALTIRLPIGNISSSIRTAAEAVRDAKGDEAKADAKKNLSELLGKFFEDDMKRRQQELTQIEERLTKLRELLERRRAKKDDILELQTKVALNEADGLGFYDGEQLGGAKSINGLIRTKIDASPFISIQPPAAPVPPSPPSVPKGTSESKAPIPTR